MALHGSSSGWFNIKSPADEYVNLFSNETPNMFDINTEEDYGLRIRLESKDLEKRIVTMTVHGTSVPEIYKTLKVTFTVTPKEHINGSRLAWMVEFEKISHDIEDPTRNVEDLVSYFKKIDRNLHQRSVLNGKVDFIDVERPADKGFKAFIKAFKNDANVEIEAKNWEARTSTMRMRSTHELMTNYKTLKVTTTITPIEDSDGINVALTIPGSNKNLLINHKRSQVAWTIESEQIPEDINNLELSFDLAFDCVPEIALSTVLHIRSMHERLRKKHLNLHRNV